jgi:N-acetylmuramoyl-L-alanine amidase
MNRRLADLDVPVRCGHRFFTVSCHEDEESYVIFALPFSLSAFKQICKTSFSRGRIEMKPFQKLRLDGLVGGIAVVLALVFSVLLIPEGAYAKKAGNGKTTGTVAKSASLGGNDERVRFVVDLSKKVKFKIFTLDAPYRVIVDLPEVKFKFHPAQGRKGKGLVSAYRSGLFAPGKSRIVIDVKQPVAIEKAYVVEPKGKRPARLVIDLVKTTKTQFFETLRKRRQQESAAGRNKPPTAKKWINPDSAAPEDDALPVVIIDPGHGGIDPGAIGAKGTLEKDVVLKFSKILRKKLQDAKKYTVRMTRDKDIYIPLHDRVRIGRKYQGSLFLSIHADSISKRRRNRNNIRGASIYMLSKSASDEEADALAKMENRSDIIAGEELPEVEDPVTDILIDLAQRETNKLSSLFANLQIKQMRGIVRMHGYYVRSAGFRVLKAPDVPSVLIELGYLSSVHDEKQLNSDEWLDKTATVIAKAVHNYFKERVGYGPF